MEQLAAATKLPPCGAGFAPGDLVALAAHGIMLPTSADFHAGDASSTAKLLQLRRDAELASLPADCNDPLSAARYGGALHGLLSAATAAAGSEPSRGGDAATGNSGSDEDTAPADEAASISRTSSLKEIIAQLYGDQATIQAAIGGEPLLLGTPAASSTAADVSATTTQRDGANDENKALDAPSAAVRALQLLSARAHSGGRLDEFVTLASALLEAGKTAAPTMMSTQAAAEAGYTITSSESEAIDNSSSAVVSVPASLSPAASSALCKIGRKLRIIPPTALQGELARDTGTTLRRLLHHGLHIVPLASSCSVDNHSREARRTSGQFCSVAALGAPVKAGKWFYEVTILSKDLMQVRGSNERRW